MPPLFELPQRPVLCTSGSSILWHDKEASENLPGVRQIIPYLIIHCGERILTYRRKSGDPRLQSQLSIGIGGHVEYSDYLKAIELCKYDPFPTARSVDVPFHYVVAYAAYRELLEECFALEELLYIFNDSPVPEPYAFWLFCNAFFGHSTVHGLHDLGSHPRLELNDDPVSTAHLGIVAHIHLPTSMVDRMVHTEEHEVVGWLLPSDLKAKLDDGEPFELWSQHVIQSLVPAPALVPEPFVDPRGDGDASEPQS